MNLTKTDVLGIALFLIIGSCTLQAKAEVRLGAGVNCGVPAGDGIWEQINSPAVRDDCDNAVSLQYIGQTSLSWLDFMAGLSYHKGSTITHGQWVSDDCYYSGQFHGGREVRWFDSQAKPECDVRWRTALVDSTSRSLTFALVPTYKAKDWSLYTTLGLSYFRSVTKIEWDQATWPEGHMPLNEAKYYPLSDTSLYFDVGATYKQMFMTVYYVPNERGGEAPNSGNYGLIAGVRF